MSTVEKSIDVTVPIRTAYNQWTQFEEFPRFMEGVREVRQLDDRRLRWCAEVGGKEKEWDAEITEQIPDERIAWRNTTGARNAGVVTFHRLAAEKTRVMVQMDYEPEGFMESAGDFFGAMSGRVENDLERFKQFIETRGQETGAWRGEIPQSPAQSAAAARRPEQTQPRTSPATEREATIPVVEEELEVGKRAKQQDVRVHTRVTERPVEEQVRLREEQVHVERRPVDRPVSAADRQAMREGTIEVSETREEPVVSKQARVVEEVAIRKDVEQHTETVRDTVRRTEVEVEQEGAAQAKGRAGFEAYAADCRNNFRTTFGNRPGATYEKYEPAYRYGHTLATDTRYAGKDWTAFESEARRNWETRHPGQGAWDDVKDAVRYAWDRARGHTPRAA